MFDLDAAEKLPEYEVKFKDKVHTYDTVLIVQAMAEKVTGVTDPGKLRDIVSEIFSLKLSTPEALALLHDFEAFSAQWEGLLKKLFGRTPSSSTTTDSVLSNASDSAPDSDSASNATSDTSTPSE